MIIAVMWRLRGTNPYNLFNPQKDRQVNPFNPLFLF